MARHPTSEKPAKTRRKRAAPPNEDKKRASEKFTHVFDDPNNVKRAIRALFLVCVVSFVLDFVIDRHIDHPWETFTAFYAFYGFVACVLLVLVAKAMRVVLMRKETYYDD